MKNKRIIVLIPVVLLVVTLVIVGAGIILGNKAKSASSTTEDFGWRENPTPELCWWCGSPNVSYEGRGFGTHVFWCYDCKKEYDWDDHYGGTHPEGKCGYCGEPYQEHGKSTTVSRYLVATNTHRAEYKCKASGCDFEYQGDGFELHSGQNHENGGKCRLCGAQYVTHKKSTTLADPSFRYDYITHTKIYKCSVEGCDFKWEDETSEPHNYGIETVTKEPTCQETGTAEKECRTCYYVTHRIVPKSGHTEVTIPAVAATCTTAGKTEGKKCSVCSTVLQAQTTVAAKGHKEVTIPAVAATCTTAGKTEGKKCSVCSTVLQAQTTVPAKGHTEVTIPAVAATCTTAGKTEGKKCSVCKSTLTTPTRIPATGHTEVTDPAVVATCTTKGKTQGKHCSVCNTVLQAQTEIPAKGHTEVTIPAVAATCTTAGKTAGKKCSVCSTVLQAQTTVAAKGHTYERKSNANEHWEVCTKCGEEKANSRKSHTVTTWTDKGNGKHGGKCTVCNYEATESHTEVVDPAVVATCTEKGKTEGKHCRVCNAVTVAQSEIPATGHTYERKSNANEHWEVCTKCGEEKANSRKSHTVTTWTNKENGTHSGNCTTCNYEVIASHNYTDGTCTACGAKEPVQECEHTYERKSNGEQHWEVCTKCGMEKPNSRQSHTVTTWADKGDGKHGGNCTVCNYEVIENHSNGINSDCSKCGYKANAGGNNQGGNNQGGNNQGDNNQGGNNQGGNNQGNNGNQDNTQSNKPIPQTGTNAIFITIGILALGTLATISITKLKKYRDIK